MEQNLKPNVVVPHEEVVCGTAGKRWLWPLRDRV